jgi:hypothetical protein
VAAQDPKVVGERDARLFGLGLRVGVRGIYVVTLRDNGKGRGFRRREASLGSFITHDGRISLTNAGPASGQEGQSI